MKYTIFLLTIVLFFFQSKGVLSQEYDESQTKYYSVEEAIENPEAVTAIEINYRWKEELLPKEIANCTNIKAVKISAQRFMKYDKIIDQLSKLPCIEKLDLYDVANLPASIGDFANLKHLKIMMCKDKTVPWQISKLTKLEHLDLFRNKFEEFPDELSELQNLNYLSLSDNNIKVIPEFVVKLPELDTLDLGYNDLEDLSEAFGNLENLIYLNVCFNELKSLPASIGKLTKLKFLKLGWNYDLVYFPKEIGNLKSLEVLNMYGCDNDPCNGLLEIPEEMGKLTNLKRLDFGWCYVSFVPKQLKNLKNLEFFRLVGDLDEAELENAKQILSHVKEVSFKF